MIESEAIKHRLNLINKVRARGVGDHIALPQLVVCGDQSAGKSSVLEGITGIPFPRKDGLCTKFPTEIVLRHAECERSIAASIIPHASRDEASANKLRKYARSLSEYDELPDVIEEVARLLRIKEYTDDENAPKFAADVLRIEVIGATGLHLTIVDLPGLIAASEDDADIACVKELVDSYLESSRTIILAVIPAPSDIETQGIIQRTRHFDKPGERTVGILTKPDLINKQGHGKVVQLLHNKGPLNLELGFFILKNPDPEELEQEITFAERKKKERDFFQDSKWTSLSPDANRVGIDALRTFLESLLEAHIERELPKVHAEISRLLDTTKSHLEDLGDARNTVADQRLFLSNLSMGFMAVAQSAVNGTYQSTQSDFFTEECEGVFRNRLRAHVHGLNTKFSDYMRDWSGKRQLSLKDYPLIGRFSTLPKPIEVTEEGFHAWILKVYENTRGLELPGNGNHTLLMELFQEHSSRWSAIAWKHTTTVHQTVCDFVDRAIVQIVKEDRVKMELRHITKSLLKKYLDAALQELDRILDDEKCQPITYNHYFTDNVQKARQGDRKDIVKQAFDKMLADRGGNLHLSNNSYEHDALLISLKNGVQVNMDLQACNEASTALKAYYKVAMKTFVDNVCRQVIERHIISKLPLVFHPTAVLRLSDEEVERIAAEPSTKVEKRKELTNLVNLLSESLDDLQH